MITLHKKNQSQTNFLPSGWTIEEIRTLDQINSVRLVWQEIQGMEHDPAVEANIERYISVMEGIREAQPYIILVRQNDRPQAMIIGRLEKQSIPVRIGYKTIIAPRLRCLTVVYGGIIGRLEGKMSDRIIQYLMTRLQDEVDVVFFNHLRTDSPIATSALKVPSILCRQYFPKQQIHWRQSMPDSIESFYRSCSKKHRGNLKRSIKRLECDYPDLHIIHHIGQDGIDQIVKDVLSISCVTYQHQLQAGFDDNNLTRSILTMDTQLNRMVMSILYIEGEPVAFQWGTKYSTTYFLEKIGYDPKWSTYGVGTVLFVKTLEYLTQDKSIQQIDYGFGAAQYKESYGDSHWIEMSVNMYSQRIYPVIINVLISINSLLTAGLGWVIRKLNLEGKIKRLWRRKLQKATLSKPDESKERDE